MAKNKIRGVTIELGGDTTEFQKSLKEVDGKLSATQKNLKDINKLLKLDPRNTDLLRQKQENLKTAISGTKDRLKELKDAYKKIDGKSSDEAKQQQQALKREIIETEQNLKSLKEQYRDFGSVAKQKLTDVGNSIKEAGGKISDAGKDMTMKVTAPLLALGTVGINYNAQMEQYKAMFTTLTGSAEEADRIISQLQEDAQKSPFDSESLMQANQYLISAGVNADEARQVIQNLGNAVAATGGGSAELSRMAQNIQQIKNVGTATSQDIKQFANAGINIYGLLAEATGKPIEKVKEMDVSYELLSEALAKASAEGGIYYGAMEAQGQTLNGSLSATKESIQMLLGEITASAMPIIVQVLNKVREVIKWFSNLSGSTKKIILIVGAAVAAIGPVVTILGSVISFVGTVVTGIGALMNPITLVVAAIGVIIGVIARLISTNETFKSIAVSVWTTFKNTLSTVASFVSDKISWISNKFSSLRDAIASAFDFSGAVSRIKDFFGSFGSEGLNATIGRGRNQVTVLDSGGLMSGSITMNNSFTINGDVDKATVLAWADVLTERINENLGRMV